MKLQPCESRAEAFERQNKSSLSLTLFPWSQEETQVVLDMEPSKDGNFTQRLIPIPWGDLG